jgi:hypothetical protein
LSYNNSSNLTAIAAYAWSGNDNNRIPTIINTYTTTSIYIRASVFSFI